MMIVLARGRGRALTAWVMLIIGLVAHPAQAQTGACCVGTSCSLRTLSSCDSVGGDWQGPGTNCSVNPCAPATGTCCTGSTCTLRTLAQCTSVSGTFLGGSSCSPNPCVGSCCLNGSCSITTSSSCSSSGGAWLRFGSCSPNICPGPCCDNGVCTVTVQSLCTGGAAWTPGGTCSPNSCLPPQCDAEITGNTGGKVTAVARVSTTGLLVARGATLELYNTVNASSPAPFNPPRRIALASPAREIAISPGSSRAFVLMENDDVTYITIVTSPHLLMTDPVTIPGDNVTDIEADGDRVYIARSFESDSSAFGTIFVYERGVDGQPRFVDQFDPFLQNFAIDHLSKIGSVLWLGMHEHESNVYGVEGWNVSNPAAPVRVTSSLNFAQLGIETELSTMQAVGNRLLVSFLTQDPGDFPTNKLRAVDVTNPALPVWHPAVDVDGFATCASVNGNHLRICEGNRTQTWDTTNPASLALLGSITDVGVLPVRISSGASNDYVAAGPDGLRTISFINPATPQVQSSVPTVMGGASMVRQIGNTTVVYDAFTDSLRLFDLTRPESQQVLGTLAIGPSAYDRLELASINNGAQTLACLGYTHGGAIRIIEITTPSAPALRGSISSDAWLMSAAGSRLYVFTNASELKVYDLTNPAVPQLLSTTQYGGSRVLYESMTSWNDGATRAVALGTESFGLWLIDATDGSSPQVVSVYAPVVGYRVVTATKGPEFLYVNAEDANFIPRLESLDVSNLASPVAAYVSGVGQGAGPTREYRELAYVASPAGRLLVGLGELGTDVDLFDLNGPLGESVLHRVESALVPFVWSLAFNASGTRAHLACGEAGLVHLSLPITWSPGSSAPAPGPRDGCLGGSLPITVDARANPNTLTYQWFRSGTPAVALSNGPTATGTVISGVTTPTLNLSNLHVQDDNTSYFCRVTNSCGSSDSARVTIEICIADINCSGTATVQDIFDFLALYFAGNSVADVNGVGGLSVQDIFDFLAAYFAGCE